MLKRSALRSGRNAIRATSWAISSPCALKVIHPPNTRRPAVFWFTPSFKTTWSGSVSPLPAASKSRSFRCFQILERPSMPFLPVYTGVSSKTFRYLLMGPRQSLLQELQYCHWASFQHRWFGPPVLVVQLSLRSTFFKIYGNRTSRKRHRKNLECSPPNTLTLVYWRLLLLRHRMFQSCQISNRH